MLDDTGSKTLAISRWIMRQQFYNLELDKMTFYGVVPTTVTAELKSLTCSIKKIQLLRSKTETVSGGFAGGTITANSFYYYPESFSVSF